MADDALLDFERSDFTYNGTTRTVYRRGTGPAVIVIAEIPGITPKVLDFARKVADLGCTAVLPHLFGIPGLDPNASNLAALKGMASVVPACVSKEFTLLATGKTSPVVDWLRALARSEHERCGGPGVGAIGAPAPTSPAATPWRWRRTTSSWPRCCRSRRCRSA